MCTAQTLVHSRLWSLQDVKPEKVNGSLFNNFSKLWIRSSPLLPLTYCVLCRRIIQRNNNVRTPKALGLNQSPNFSCSSSLPACLSQVSTRCPVRAAAAELLQIKVIQTLQLVYCFLSFSDGKSSQHHVWRNHYTHPIRSCPLLGITSLREAKLNPGGLSKWKREFGLNFTLHLLTNSTLVHVCLFYTFTVLSSVLL